MISINLAQVLSADAPCTATLGSAGESAHTCESLAHHATSPHRCSCGFKWNSGASPVQTFPHSDPKFGLLDDEPATVESVREWLVDGVETLDGLITDLHELKRQVPEEHRESIMVAANSVGQAWAHARTALTALTDVTARVALAEGTGTQGYM